MVVVVELVYVTDTSLIPAGHTGCTPGVPPSVQGHYSVENKEREAAAAGKMENAAENPASLHPSVHVRCSKITTESYNKHFGCAVMLLEIRFICGY